MGAEQRPLGIPAHLCKAEVSSPPLQHVVSTQERGVRYWRLSAVSSAVSALFFGSHFLIRSRRLPCSHSVKIKRKSLRNANYYRTA